jgi:23S rRNA (uracil1939-C5)-methyltransferase
MTQQPTQTRRKRQPEPPRHVRMHLDDLSYFAEGVGRVDDEVYFVAFGLPGEDVVAEVHEARKKFRRSRVIDVLRPSPDRVAPPCQYFGTCGGCQSQHIAYASQLAFKRRAVEEQLRRIGGFESPPVLDTIGSPNPWNYRNHVRFSTRRDGSLGFTLRQSRWVLPVDLCVIALPQINDALATLQGHGAGLHQVAVRYSPRTDQMLISPRIPAVTDLETGQGFLEEEILGRRFRISPSSFFQVNTRPDERVLPDTIRAGWLAERTGAWSQAEILALLVLDLVEPTGREFVVDAYGGVGTFALLLAERVGRVLGIEESRSAILNARHNATGVDNVEFVEQKTEIALPVLTDRPDAVVLDPARAGCAPPVLDALLDLHPERIVYVSCDPATLARDLRRLADGGYDVRSVQPVDMFPQTYHVETVTLLTLR